ncbi:MAG: GtrA family protein [Rikenellaceae bacterium]|nr:GtrA family protein [Rikenellaceae bacterium]
MKRLIDKILGRLYFYPLKKFIPYVTFRYAACGGLNMVLDWTLYFILYNFILRKENVDLGFVVISPYIAAFLIVFPITFFTGFWLNNNIAFHGSPLKNGVKMSRYLMVVCVSLLINYFGLKLLVEHFHIYPTPSKILVTLAATAVSYFSQKYFTFRRHTA